MDTLFSNPDAAIAGFEFSQRALAYLWPLNLIDDLLLYAITALSLPYIFQALPGDRRRIFWLLFPGAVCTLLGAALVQWTHFVAPYPEQEAVGRLMFRFLISICTVGISTVGLCLFFREREGEDYPPLRAFVRPTEQQRERSIRWGLMAGLAALAWSFFLFERVNYMPGPILRYIYGLLNYYPEETRRMIQMGGLIRAPVIEELQYRWVFQMGLMWLLTRRAKWSEREALLAAILITSVLWTIVHTNSFQYPWAKFYQIFPIGLLLGWLSWRVGIWAAIMAHIVLNVSIVAMNLVIDLPPIIPRA